MTTHTATEFDTTVSTLAAAAESDGYARIGDRFYRVSRNWDGDNRYWNLTGVRGGPAGIRVAIDGSIRNASDLMPFAGIRLSDGSLG